MLTPADAEVLEIAIPLRITFRHALAARDTSRSVVLRLTGRDGSVGYGECAPREYVTGETPATVRGWLARALPRVLGQRYRSVGELIADLARAAAGLRRDEHAAFCALELALLDLWGKTTRISAGSVLGPVLEEKVRYCGVVSAEGAEEVATSCAAMREFGLTSVKLKVGRSLQEDLDALAAARHALGDACSLRVDANCAWSASEAQERIAAMAPFRLDAIEQPVRAEDLGGLARLTAWSPVPIVADESLVSLADARRLAAHRACHVFDVRISKCGGLLNSLRIAEVGREAGIACMLGAQVGETALLTAAGRHFATRVPGLRFREGSYGRFLLSEDVAAEDLTLGPDGEAPALDGPGLGVEVVEEKLRAHACAPGDT
jgi:muconate cycloisomerase